MQGSKHSQTRGRISRKRSKKHIGSIDKPRLKIAFLSKKAPDAGKQSTGEQVKTKTAADNESNEKLQLKTPCSKKNPPDCGKHFTGERRLPRSRFHPETLQFVFTFFIIFADETPSAKYRKNEGGETTRATPRKT